MSFVCVSVDPIQHCLLGLQSLCFGFSFGRTGASFFTFGAIFVKKVSDFHFSQDQSGFETNGRMQGLKQGDWPRGCCKAPGERGQGFRPGGGSVEGSGQIQEVFGGRATELADVGVRQKGQQWLQRPA